MRQFKKGHFSYTFLDLSPKGSQILSVSQWHLNLFMNITASNHVETSNWAADLSEIGSFISHSLAILLDLTTSNHISSQAIASRVGESARVKSTGQPKAGAPTGTYCFFKGMLWIEAAWIWQTAWKNMKNNMNNNTHACNLCPNAQNWSYFDPLAYTIYRSIRFY